MYDNTKKVLDNLPGLIGALDSAVKDITGAQQPLVLIIFVDGHAMHISNADPAAMRKAVTDLVSQWAQGDIGDLIAES